MGFFTKMKDEAQKQTIKDGNVYHVIKTKDGDPSYITDAEKNKKGCFSFYNTSDILKEKEGITIVIAARNEKKHIYDTLDSIYNTVDLYKCNIIIVDDCSNDGTTSEMFNKYRKFAGLFEYIRHDIRQGVGAALTTGAYAAKTPYIVLMGADIRFMDNKWSEKFIEHLSKKDNKKSIICSNCLTLNENKGKVDPYKATEEHYGAGIILYLNKKTSSRRSEGWRNIIEARWRRKIDKKGLNNIPCILGACYGVRKDWFEHIKGFELHKFWGTLEPYISLKSYLAGGDCKCDSELKTGHVFHRNIIRTFEPSYEYYNKIMVANTLFPYKFRNHLLKFYKEDASKKIEIAKAEAMYKENKKLIDSMKRYYKKIFTRDIFDVFDELGIDYSKFTK